MVYDSVAGPGFARSFEMCRAGGTVVAFGRSAGDPPRETMEEACAEVEIGHLFASVDVPQAGQVHVFYTARLVSDFAPGAESLEVAMYAPDEIPWDDIAFPSGRFALEKWIEDGGRNNGVHEHIARRRLTG